MRRSRETSFRAGDWPSGHADVCGCCLRRRRHGYGCAQASRDQHAGAYHRGTNGNNCASNRHYRPDSGACYPTAAPDGPETVSLEISVNGDALAFDKSEFSAGAGSEVVLTFSNVSIINQHNWVIVQPGTKDDVAARGTAAGPDNDWVQPDDPDVIANTKLLDAGATGEVTFAAPPAGTYQFVCTFPGHNFTMFGDFEVTG